MIIFEKVVIEKIRRLIEKDKVEVSHLNKRSIAISNIAWSGDDSEPFLDLVASEGAHGIELVTSLIWEEPVETTFRERNKFRVMIEERGLVVTGLHSLLFPALTCSC